MKQRAILTGKEGIDLIHRLSTIDVERLQIAQARLGLILNPQGKIRSIFSITLISSDQAQLEFDPSFLEILEQYTFGEKYSLSQTVTASELPADEKSELTRIQNLQPALGHEFSLDEMTNPLDIHLRSAIDEQKGCYPGQEVIEKIISLGQPARKLCLIELQSESTAELPQAITNEQGHEIGSLTSASQGFGLAIIKRIYAKAGLATSAGNVIRIAE